jgi:hypothetical protein
MSERTDDRLDLLLQVWGSEQRLDDGEADALLRAILTPTPTPLPATWWSDLSAQVSAAVVLATVRPAAHPVGGVPLAAMA